MALSSIGGKIKGVISSKDQDLLEAAKTGNVEAIVKLTSKKRQSTASQVFTSFLKGSVNINCVDREGYTPLHLTTLNGHKSAVECLLNLDALVSSKDNSGCTPLHLAAWKGYDEICKLFLTFTNATIPIDVQNSLGDTALHMAAQYGYKNVVDVLLQYNVDATIRNLKDQSALDLAAQYGRHDVVQLLVTKNPDLVKHTVTSHSPLHLAAACGHVQIISTLIGAGYDINTTTTAGTALHTAAMYCKTDVVKLLVEKGIDIHAQDGEGKTALEIVLKNDQSQQKYAEIAKLIRDHIMISGADDPDDSNVYDTSFNVKSAAPPPLAPAVDEDVTKDQTNSSKPEDKEEPEVKTRPVPKPRLSLGDAGVDEERKSALYTKPDKNRDKNRIDDSPVSVTIISPPKPAPRESKAVSPEPAPRELKAISPEPKIEQHYPPDLPKKERDSVPPLPPKTDDIPILPPKVMSPTADMVVADLPPVRTKSQEPLDGPPPCEGGIVDSEYTEEIYANVSTGEHFKGYFAMTKPVDTEGSTLSPASKKKRPAKPPRKKSPAPSRKMEHSPINIKEIDKEEYETMSNVQKTESSFTEDVYNALFSSFKTDTKDSSDSESQLCDPEYTNMSTASESPSCDAEYTNISTVSESLSCDPEYTNIGTVSESRSCDPECTNKSTASESLSCDPEYTNTSTAAEYRSSKVTADHEDAKTVPFTKYSETTSPSKDIRTERVESHCTELRGEIQSTSRSNSVGSTKLDRSSTGFGQTNTSDEIQSKSKDPLSVIDSQSDKTIPEMFDSKENTNDCSESISGTEKLCESNNCDSDIPDGNIRKSCSINKSIPEKRYSIGDIPDNCLQTDDNIPQKSLQSDNNIPQNSFENENSVSVVSCRDITKTGAECATPEIKPRPLSYKPLADSSAPELPPKTSLSDLSKDLVVDEKRISNGSGEPKDCDDYKAPKPHSLEFTKKRLSEHRFPTTPTGYPQPPTPDFPPPSPHTARKGIEQKIADIEVPSNKRSSRDIETITEDLVTDGKTSGDNLSKSNTKEASDQTDLQKVDDNIPIKEKESTELIENESDRRSHDKKDEEVVVLRKSSRSSNGSGQEVLIGDDLEPFAAALSNGDSSSCLLRGSAIGGPRKVVSQIYEHVAVPLKRTSGKRTSLPLSNMTFEPVMEREEDGGHEKRSDVEKSLELTRSGMKEDSSFDDKDEWDQIADIVSSFGGKLSHDETVSVNDTDMNHLLEGSNPSIHSVGEWLESLSLGQYENTLYANGFDDTDFLGEKIMEEQDLESIGISTAEHRKKILDLAKRLPQIKPINAECPPVSVEVWLNSLRLPQYLDKFMSHKYNTMERVLQVWELELSTVLDISSMGHRKRILASLGDRSPPERQFASLKKKSRVEDHQEKKSPFTDINLYKDYTKVKPLTSTSEEENKSSSKPQTPSVENSDNDEVFQNNVQGKSIKDTSIHIRPPHQANTTAPIKQWRHRPEMLIKGCCNYTAQYLGSTLVKELTGTSSTIEGITKLKSKFKRKIQKSADAIAKIPTIMLSISYRGVKFIDAKSKKVICDHEIVNIFCACQDAESMNFFAYITRDNETCKHYCHVFSVRTADLAREVIMTLGEAFEVAYQMAQKEKAAEEAKEFERTLSQSDAEDSSQSKSSSKASLNTV
ncbi:ankyrin repeat and sterile alpha motif domain-containing protein 1B-like isoform X3 [Mytilus californianus]|uniref:ankyrin repeat and sterile alpha motif domain-containing protein 1B-like isoform X3 n=1 Tax=Mytilus californianus TaxID=6549 RepID=UPI002246F55D|nr:ankyrin repeat and sterile alpha motif domain-containing protein 1B-like isoform X3 [Mytilus californianus]